jgi:hypothetical protein
MFRRQHLLVSLSVALLTAAFTSGCGEVGQATPRVTFDSSISPGTHSSQECTQTGTWFTIGSFGNPALGQVNPGDPASPLKDPVRPVDDGGEDQQGTAAVSCSVLADGDGFDVKLSAELTGATGGAMIMTGHVLRDIGSPSPNITLTLSRQGETYSAANCLMTFPVSGQGVAAGRIWGEVNCADAEAPSVQRICATEAQIRFENCAQ